MFCTNCGAQLPEGSTTCSKCNASLASAPRSEGGISKIFLGLGLLVLSFFTMPLKTFKLTLVQLKEIGGKGKLNVEATEVPHLTWLEVTAHVIASIVVIGIIIYFIIRGFNSFGELLEDSVSDAVKELISNILTGIFFAIVADWAIMLTLELISLGIIVANNIKKIAEKGL